MPSEQMQESEVKRLELYSFTCIDTWLPAQELRDREKNNKRMKSKGVFGDLFNKEERSILRKLEVVAPEIEYFMRVMEDQEVMSEDRKHKLFA